MGRGSAKTGKTYIWLRLFTFFIPHIEDPGWQIHSFLCATADFLPLPASSPALVPASSSNSDNGNKALVAAVP